MQEEDLLEMELREIKKQLGIYREPLYMLFLIPQFICVAWGWGSADWPYRAAFAFGTICLLLSMAGTDYNIKEVLVMGGLTVLAAVAFYQNKNRSLILACMAVFGCKNMNLKKILKYVFWILAVCMTVKIVLCAVGILPNEMLSLPKENGKHYILYGYGYDTPNNLYFHLVICVMLAMVLYGERIRWSAVFLVTAFMCGAYKVLFSRTGFLCYLLLLVLYILYSCLRNPKARLWMLRLLSLSPVILCLLNWGLVHLYETETGFIAFLNQLLNSRLYLASQAFGRYSISLFGSKGAVQLDMLYSTMLLNYGVILSVVCVGAYAMTMFRLCNEKRGLVVIAMTVLAVYSFMEMNVINPMWNPFLLFLVLVLFEKQNTQSWSDTF